MSLLYDTRGNRKYLTIAERRAFLRAAQGLPPEARGFCKVLAYTGARISEVLELTPARIDIDNQVIVFESLKKRRRGTFRAVPVPASLLAELDRIHCVRTAQRDPTRSARHLFSMGRTWAWMRVKATMAAAGICGPQATTKGLRHAFAIAALQSGVPLNLVRKWLGHARLSTTAIYADAVGDEERSIARRLWKTF